MAVFIEKKSSSINEKRLSMEQNCFNKIKSHYLKRIKAWPFRSVKYDYEKQATFKKEGKLK